MCGVARRGRPGGERRERRERCAGEGLVALVGRAPPPQRRAGRPPPGGRPHGGGAGGRRRKRGGAARRGGAGCPAGVLPEVSPLRHSACRERLQKWASPVASVSSTARRSA